MAANKARLYRVDLIGRIVRPPRHLGAVKVKARSRKEAERKALNAAAVILAGSPYSVEAVAL